jgi:hypothetical protein
MPNYAHLAAELRCPYCDHIFSELVWFQWGFCPSSGVNQNYIYRIGDPVRWKECSDGSIVGWTYFVDKQRSIPREANIGDPTIANLVVIDAAQFLLPDRDDRRLCERCHQPLEGAAIEIRNAIMQRAWIFQPGEFDRGIDYYLLNQDGGYLPKPDWVDHQMSIVDC